MPIEIRDSVDGVGVLFNYRGFVTERDYVDALTGHLTHDEEKFKTYRYSFSDITALTTTDISSEAITSIGRLCERAAKINPHPVVALVADRDLPYGLGRMWEMMSDATGWETGVFRNREDAESWIRERVKTKYEIDDVSFEPTSPFENVDR